MDRIIDKYDNEFSDDELSILLEQPVFIGRMTPTQRKNYLTDRLNKEEKNGGQAYAIERYKNFVQSKDKNERIVNLYLTVKQIRNNLFHGQKTIDENRDRLLINAGIHALDKIREVVCGDYD